MVNWKCWYIMEIKEDNYTHAFVYITVNVSYIEGIES
nr:MAG TPA: hypothetical protein [Caudoviricetes sp.]